MNKKALIFSLPCVLSVVSVPGFAEIRIGNSSRSYAADYAQVAALQNSATTTATVVNDGLPIRVANKDLVTRILNNDKSLTVNTADLESCAAIYPSGNFAWDKPNAGTKSGTTDTCISVVEMRVINGNSDIVVATANVAAGDAIVCNIEKFPAAFYTQSASSVVFPADREPTMDEVVNVMNAEQKKNAGFKIAAGLIVGGLAGNAAGKNDLGNDSIMGTDKGKMQGTAIGALSGAAIMAGSSYAGKVGGDMILSGGVNAAAGAVVGNMAASGDSVLRIEDCKNTYGVTSKCLWGVVQKYTPIDEKTHIAFYNIDNGDTIVCENNTSKDDFKNCKEQKIIGFTPSGYYKSIEEGKKDGNFKNFTSNTNLLFSFDKKEGALSGTVKSGYNGNTNGRLIPTIGGGTPTQRINAMIFGFEDSAFGKKIDDWYKWKAKEGQTAVAKGLLFGRNNLGEANELPNIEKTKDKNGNEITQTWTIEDFYPLTVDADDGNIIDINNKARLKSTLTGAGVGAGLGAFSAYQGANDEITQRWISAVQEYKDSLQKVYCATGTRFLSQYNDTVIIPNITVTIEK